MAHSSKRLNRRQIAAAILARSRELANHHEGHVETIVVIGDSTTCDIHDVGEEIEAEAWRDGIKLTAMLIDAPVTMTTQWHPHPVDEPECNCACDQIDARTVWRNDAATAALV